MATHEHASPSLSVCLSQLVFHTSEPLWQEVQTDGRDRGQLKHIILSLVLLAQVKPPSPRVLISLRVSSLMVEIGSALGTMSNIRHLLLTRLLR